jgi:hypothetical protein
VGRGMRAWDGSACEGALFRYDSSGSCVLWEYYQSADFVAGVRRMEKLLAFSKAGGNRFGT